MPITESSNSYIDELWVLYGVATLTLLTRFFVRFRTVGLRKFQGDDFFSFIVLILYASGSASTYLIYFLGTNVEGSFFLKKEGHLSDLFIHDFTIGSKLEVVCWYSYTGIIWSLKASMLFFLGRMTIGTWHNIFVKIVSVVCVVSYVVVFFTITFSCFPFHKNWQVVPDPGLKCTFKMQNIYVTTVFNVLSDALILSIPVPMLWKLQVPLKRKIAIGILLSSGAFVIAAAIIRIVLTLSASPSALTINSWGVRETLVGVVTVNVPVIRPIFMRSFWTGEITTSLASSYHNSRGTGGSRSKDPSGPYELTTSVNDEAGYTRGGHDSQESIANKVDAPSSVVVSTTYGISHENDEFDRYESISKNGTMGNTASVRAPGEMV